MSDIESAVSSAVECDQQRNRSIFKQSFIIKCKISDLVSFGIAIVPTVIR